MTDDIVTRLRNWHTEHDSAFPRPIDLEAADEIESLRAEVSRLRQVIVDASPDDDYFLVRKEADAIWEIAHNWKMPSE